MSISHLATSSQEITNSILIDLLPHANRATVADYSTVALAFLNSDFMLVTNIEIVSAEDVVMCTCVTSA